MNRIITSSNCCHLMATVSPAMANKHEPTRLALTFLLIFCADFVVASERCECENDGLYVIRSIGPNGLVLDATDPKQVRVQHFTGSDTQLWKFLPVGRPGLYYIINEHQGKTLDVVTADDGVLHLVVNDLHKSLQQQWNFDREGHLVNAATGKNVDIYKDNFSAGNQLIVWENNGCNCQKFTFQKKITGI